MIKRNEIFKWQKKVLTSHIDISFNLSINPIPLDQVGYNLILTADEPF